MISACTVSNQEQGLYQDASLSYLYMQPDCASVWAAFTGGLQSAEAEQAMEGMTRLSWQAPVTRDCFVMSCQNDQTCHKMSCCDQWDVFCNSFSCIHIQSYTCTDSTCIFLYSATLIWF